MGDAAMPLVRFGLGGLVDEPVRRNTYSRLDNHKNRFTAVDGVDTIMGDHLFFGARFASSRIAHAICVETSNRFRLLLPVLLPFSQSSISRFNVSPSRAPEPFQRHDWGSWFVRPPNLGMSSETMGGDVVTLHSFYNRHHRHVRKPLQRGPSKPKDRTTSQRISDCNA